MSRIIHSGMQVEDALTCTDKVTRTMARCTVSGWIEQFSDWVNGEMQRPDSDPMAMVQAMSIVFIQTIGSVAAQVSRPSGDAVLKDAVIALVEDQLLNHMQRTRMGDQT